MKKLNIFNLFLDNQTKKKQKCKPELSNDFGTTTVTKVIKHYHRVLYLILLGTNVFDDGKYTEKFFVVNNFKPSDDYFSVDKVSCMRILKSFNRQLNNDMLNADSDVTHGTIGDSDTQFWFPKHKADKIVEELHSDPFNHPFELTIDNFVKNYCLNK